MKTRWNRTCGWVMLGLVMAIFGLCACEETERGTAIVVTPSSSTLYIPNGTVVLTAAPADDRVVATNQVDALYLPLKWRVSNPALGGVTSKGGYTAVYVSTGRVGQNSVIVEDQAGSEGVAVINQRPKSEQMLDGNVAL